MERPALQGLLAEIRASPIDIVVIYKVDGLTRPLADLRGWPRSSLSPSTRIAWWYRSQDTKSVKTLRNPCPPAAIPEDPDTDCLSRPAFRSSELALG